MPEPGHAEGPRPRSRTDLFVSFTLLALQGFGGVAGVVQRELVERKQWLTPEEFIEDWAVAQIMPGPNVVNLSLMIGARYFGWTGALAALAGMSVLPLIVVLMLAAVHARYATNVGLAGALRGMAAVSAGILAAAGLKLGRALSTNALPLRAGLGLCALTFVLVAWLRVPLPIVLVAVGGPACWLAYRCIRRMQAESAKMRRPP